LETFRTKIVSKVLENINIGRPPYPETSGLQREGLVLIHINKYAKFFRGDIVIYLRYSNPVAPLRASIHENFYFLLTKLLKARFYFSGLF